MLAVPIYLMSKQFNNKKAHCSTLSATLFLGLFYTFATDAMAADLAEKIFITADHMQMNIISGNSVYTGNVKISQGALILTGDKVILESKKEEFEELTVMGNPARYNHVFANGENVKAESEHMVYTASKNELILTINARLEQSEHKLSSQKIIYDTLKQTIIAGTGSTDKPQRVNIVLTPKKPPTDKPQP